MTSFAFVCRSASSFEAVQIVRQAEALAVTGNQIDIFAPSGIIAPTDITFSQIHVHSLGAAPKPGTFGIGAAIFWLQTSIIITLAQLRHRYHLIQINGSTNLFIFTTWLAHLLGAKIVLDIGAALPEQVMASTGSPRLSVRVRAAVIIEQLTVDFVDHIITSTEPLRARFISRGCDPDKISVIYRTPDEERFGKSLTVARHPNIAEAMLIVSYNRAGGHYDLATLIRAVATVHERIPQTLLWIVCEASLHPPLESLVRQLKATKYILIQDEMSEDDIPAFLSQADINVVADSRNILTDLLLPIGLLESVALNVPTVALRTQATFYYFDAKTLSTYEQEDSGELATQLEQLARSENRRTKMRQMERELTVQINWSRERHRYMALLQAVAATDVSPERTPADAAGRSRLSRRPNASARTFRTAQAEQGMNQSFGSSQQKEDSSAELAALPLRISEPSQEWRAGRQFRMRMGAWGLRITATILLFAIPILSTSGNKGVQLLTALMFAGVVFLLLLLPPGEAAIIIAIYFVVQRALFTRFIPEGRLGPLLLYLGTALQLIIFIGFSVRAIIQQRPLFRSRFVLWPAVVYVMVCGISAFTNHVPLMVMLLGTEHTLHNLIFVVLIAEDLPTPQQLRRYVGVIIVLLTALATISIGKTLYAFGIFGSFTRFLGILQPNIVPTAAIAPDADTFAYLLNFGILLTIAILLTSNTRKQESIDENAQVMPTNIALGAALILLTVGLFLTNSVENWIGLMLGIVALTVILRGRLKFAALGYLAVIGLLCFLPYTPIPGGPAVTLSSEIVALTHGVLPHSPPISQTVMVIHDHPLLGVGPGRFGGTVASLSITRSPLYPLYDVNLAGTVTSINLFWLHIWAETGIVGLLTMLWLLGQTIQTIWLAYRRGAYAQWNGITAGVFGIVFAISFATFFGNALEIDSLSAPFWALVGIAVALPLATRPLITEKIPTIRFRASSNSDEPSLPPSQLPQQKIDATLIRP